MKRILLALLLVVAACGDGSSDPPAGSDPGSTNTTAEPGGIEPVGGDSGGGDPGTETSSDGTRIFVSAALGIDIVDLTAETQEVFVDGYDRPYGLMVAHDHLWFADSGNSLVSIDALSGVETGTAALQGQFSGLAVTDDVAWVIAGLIGADSRLVGIDRDGMTVRGTAVPPEGTYYDLVAAVRNRVWVHGGDIESSTSVSKVNPVTVEVGDPVDSGVIADSMVAGLGALWVGGTTPLSPDGSTGLVSAIAKLDSSSGEVISLFEIGGHGDGEVVLEVAFGFLWATQGLDGVLIKIDPDSGSEIARVDVGSGAAGNPYPILLTSDAIWVVNTTDDRALSFDPDTLEFEVGINLPTFAGAFAFVP